ncbi:MULTISPECIES: NAD(P)H-binding protein [Capnocytophaga]|uniref:NAD(P)H-binding protein n=1 Tax=Capnocytophaga TaxID=1016 RepID=UPI00027C6A98|nr:MULTISPECIES: NAD(P)H-binding protein [Capnocytophaga]EJU27879.1 NADH(P)-binding protein, PF13460 family [Capnocytophaga sp. CM59]
MKALIIGATGATGKDLVTQLLADDTYSEVHCFVRKPLTLTHPKLHTHVVDFENPKAWADLLRGDVAFSCLGTTLAVAGSKEAQWRVDYDYQYNFAELCHNNGVPTFVLVSAAGAKAPSKLFYNRMKGQLEDAIKALGFARLLIFQPSVLVRKGSDRKGEQFGLKMIVFLNKLGLFKRYRPMPTAILAQKMRKEVATAPKGVHTFTLDEIFH